MISVRRSATSKRELTPLLLSSETLLRVMKSVSVRVAGSLGGPIEADDLSQLLIHCLTKVRII